MFQFENNGISNFQSQIDRDAYYRERYEALQEPNSELNKENFEKIVACDCTCTCLDRIPTAEFKKFINELIHEKQGALPDLHDWKKIKSMLSRVYDENDEDGFCNCCTCEKEECQNPIEEWIENPDKMQQQWPEVPPLDDSRPLSSLSLTESEVLGFFNDNIYTTISTG